MPRPCLIERVGDEIPAPRKSPGQNTTSLLRRSTRKRSMPPGFTSMFSSPPPSAKKSRKAPKVPPLPVIPPTLLTLPYCAISRLLLCLDVASLENLSATCYYFDQLIAGKFLLALHFPFPVGFIKEVMADNCFEKKPLLKISCKKSWEDFQTIPDLPGDLSESSSTHKLIIGNSPDMMDYLVFSQMSLLSLHKLRELDLVPDSVRIDGRVLGHRIMDSYSNFDCSLLRHISSLGSLSCVTRLDVLVDHNLYLEQYMLQMPNLLELGLSILTGGSLSKHVYLNKYIPRLEAVVAASKAPILKVTVVAETRRLVYKVFKNNYVEKLVLTGPCTFNLFLVMERLKEVVVVNLDTLFFEDNCNYWKSRSDDRGLHRDGLCCVHIGSVYENCPNLERFMGVEIGSVSHNQSFNKWNTRIKKRFFDHYLQQGGSKEMKAWAKTRWFSRRPVVPKEIGYDRVFN
eukprot:GFUD01016984.1.p1 GENE.GFUD01016984.1~~GFUD01016984.1.p1  ORF type:complete len:457 (-),score=113.51 GFUD01016984.1:76-1446(-)